MNIIEDLKKLRMNCVCDRYLRNKRCAYGEWEITENEIKCHFKQEKIDDYFKNTFNYYFFLNGELNEKETAESYSLNKTFYFIFEDITFDKPIKLKCDNGNIIFKNCVFNKGIYFDDCYSVTFENNIYDNVRDRKIDDTAYIVGTAKNVQFIDENFFAVDCIDDKNFKFWVQSDNIVINNTFFDSSLMNLNLKTDYMKIQNCQIKASNIKLKANIFNGSNTNIYGSREIKLDFSKYSWWDFNFNAPKIVCNGQKILGTSYDTEDYVKIKKIGS